MNDDMLQFATGLPIRLNTRDYGHQLGRRVNPRELHQSTNGTPSIVSVDNQNNLSFCSPVNDFSSTEALFIDNESIPSESGKGGICPMSRKLRRNLLILFAVIFSCLVIAGVTAASTFIAKENEKQPLSENEKQPFSDDIQTFSAIIKVNETFDSAMSQADSTTFRNFGDRFCSNVLSFVGQTFNHSRCHVDSLSPGSIVVNFTLEIAAQTNIINKTQGLLMELFNVSQVGLLTILPESNHVSHKNDSGKKDFTLNSSTPFSYPPDSLPILPLDYTYPGYCGDYQVWSNGIFILEKCPEGEEFAYLSVNDVSICAPPSSSTYCGRKREEDVTSKPKENLTTAVKTTSSSEPLPSTFSSSMMSYKTTASSTTYPIQNTETYTSTPKISTTLKSPGQDTSTYFSSTTSSPGQPTTSTFWKLGLTSLATVTANETSEKYVSSPTSSSTTTLATTTEWKLIYTCPKGGYAFLPTKDTYPDHCDRFQVCEPLTNTTRNCAPGTHFVYSGDPRVQKACNFINDPSTFCNKMKEMKASLP